MSHRCFAWGKSQLSTLCKLFGCIDVCGFLQNKHICSVYYLPNGMIGQMGHGFSFDIKA